MEKRMNKEELLELINSLKIDKEEFWVLSSGALVLRDLLPDAGDLDIGVTEKGFNQLKDNYNIRFKEGSKFFIVNDKVEGVLDGDKDKLKYYPEKVGDIYVQNINLYLEYLKQSSREKDKARIEIVEEYIKTR